MAAAGGAGGGEVYAKIEDGWSDHKKYFGRFRPGDLMRLVLPDYHKSLLYKIVGIEFNKTDRSLTFILADKQKIRFDDIASADMVANQTTANIPKTIFYLKRGTDILLKNDIFYITENHIILTNSQVNFNGVFKGGYRRTCSLAQIRKNKFKKRRHTKRRRFSLT